MTDPRYITNQDLENAGLDIVGITCRICGERKRSRDFTECAEDCDQCLAEEREVKFQEALNEMDAGFVLTFSLLVDAYKNTLAEKEKSGENINLLMQFAKTAMEDKHKKNTFTKQPPKPAKTTDDYLVINTESHSVIGDIKWYPSFRQYSFFPRNSTSVRRSPKNTRQKRKRFKPVSPASPTFHLTNHEKNYYRHQRRAPKRNY